MINSRFFVLLGIILGAFMSFLGGFATEYFIQTGNEFTLPAGTVCFLIVSFFAVYTLRKLESEDDSEQLSC